MRSPPTNEIAADLRCGEMACKSYLHACETAATTASIGSSAAEMTADARRNLALTTDLAVEATGKTSSRSSSLYRPSFGTWKVVVNRSSQLVNEKNSNNLFPVSEKTLPLNSY